MTFLTNFFFRIGILFLVLSVLGVSAHAQNELPDASVEASPPLDIISLEPGKESPQAAESTLIPWSIEARGGVGDKQYIFELRKDGGDPQLVKSGQYFRWVWEPEVAGRYQVRGTVTDSLGNREESVWSDPFRITPPLKVSPPKPEIPGPQMLGAVSIPWTVEASGGVGDLTYTFELRWEQALPDTVQEGRSPRWVWTPERAGPHQVRVTVQDERGNQETTDWSDPYGIAPPLRIEAPAPDKNSPQAAKTVPIIWSVEAIGGVGAKTYQFEYSRNGSAARVLYTGPLSKISMGPQSEGDYRVRAMVKDRLGNQVQSDWSEIFRMTPPLTVAPPAPEVAGPQMAGAATISWSVEASGGVQPISYRLELSRNQAEPCTIELGENRTWVWSPDEAGNYRIRAVMTDALGNQQVGPWSDVYRIEPPLAIRALTPGKTSPQAAKTVAIPWTADVIGGVGEKIITFELSDDAPGFRIVQESVENRWTWEPKTAGTYRVRIAVADALGHQAQGDWSAPFVIAPPLEIASFGPEKDQPEYLVDAPISWRAEATGGVGEKTFTFTLQKKGSSASVMQTGASPQWVWTPENLGFYRARVTYSDSLGNEVQSAWSEFHEIVGPLTLMGLTVQRPSPQPALGEQILWTAKTEGGVGELIYEFQSRKDGIVLTEQAEPEANWNWRPQKTGDYQVRVVTRDAEGHQIEGAWSPEYHIGPAISRDTRIAFLPIDNISGMKAPLSEIELVYSDLLTDEGFRLLPKNELEKFMKKYRMRHTGGIGARLSQLLKEETGAEAVLITSIESYHVADPPKISVFSRVVLLGPQPEIVWMDSVGVTGVDSPGLLGLGLVKDSKVLLAKALDELIGSLNRYLSGETYFQRSMPGHGKNGEVIVDADISLAEKYLPHQYYRATWFEPLARYSVAVVPFLNKYARKNAGFVAPLHFVEKLHSYENLEVLEPGVVREQLLKYRLIMPAGPSLAISDVLASPTTLDADLILSGNVFDYQGQRGEARVDFSAQVFDGKAREVVWWSRNYATGGEGVYFFDVGRVYSAHGLMNRMAGSVSALIFNGDFP